MLTQKLEFIVNQRGQDEASVLADAVREGIQFLYREALIEAYLMGRVARQIVTEELGEEEVEELDYQRQAFEQDVAWGLKRD